jgi:hypothetical protein
MAGRGRPVKSIERSSILLRIPTTLIEQVETFKERLEAERGGFAINRTDILIRLIEVGLQTLTQARQPVAQPAPASHTNGQQVLSLALEPAPTTAQPVPVLPAAETPELAIQIPKAKPPAPHGLPRAKLQEIADERTHCEGLSLREFAQRLYDKGIYQARSKDGSRVPANAGNIKKWLEQAQTAGLS